MPVTGATLSMLGVLQVLVPANSTAQTALLLIHLGSELRSKLLAMKRFLFVVSLLFLLLITSYPPLPAQGAQSATVSNAVVDNWQTSLSLPSGAQEYIYGFITGGVPSSGFSSGQVASVINADGNMQAALAVTTSDTNSFSTSAQYPAIGGVSVSGFSSLSFSYGSNGNPGASSASDSFTVNVVGSLVVIMALGGGEQYLVVSGLPGFTIDATNFNGVCNQGLPSVIVIGHAYLNPGTYTVTEQTRQCAAGQDPNHAGDLIGVFVFGPGAGFATSTSSSITTTAASSRTTSLTSPSSTTSILEISSYSTVPAPPIEGLPFSVSIGVFNAGGAALQGSQLPQLVGTPSFPATDANGNSISNLSCILSDPQTIMPSQRATLVYACLPAQWSIIKSASLMQTAITSYGNLAEQAVSDIVSLTVTGYAGKVLGANSQQFQSFKAAYDAATSTVGIPASLDGGLATVIQLTKNYDFIPSVTFDPNFAPLNYEVLGTGLLSPVTVVVPSYKFQELAQWSQDEIGAAGISIGTATLGSAALAGCIGVATCPEAILAAAVLYAASALAGPITDVLFQNELSDPSGNYTQIVVIPPPSSTITSMPNSTYSRLLYFEYEYNANLNASAESSARGYGALKAGSASYANLQFTRAESFAANASSYFGKLQYYLNQTLVTVVPTANEKSFNDGVQLLKQNGLPLGVLQILNATGTLSYFNSTAITSMTFQPVNSTIVESLPNVGSYLESDARLQLAYAPSSTLTTSSSSTPSTTILSSALVSAAATVNSLLIYAAVGIVVVVVLVGVFLTLRGRGRKGTVGRVPAVTISPQGSAQTISPGTVEKVQRLRRMLDLGLITQEDYEEQRKRLGAG
jgi:hypothetical protein